MRFHSSFERLVLMVIHVQFFKLRCWESIARRWSGPATARAGRPTHMVFRKVRRFIMEIEIRGHLRRSAAKFESVKIWPAWTPAAPTPRAAFAGPRQTPG